MFISALFGGGGKLETASCPSLENGEVKCGGHTLWNTLYQLKKQRTRHTFISMARFWRCGWKKNTRNYDIYSTSIYYNTLTLQHHSYSWKIHTCPKISMHFKNPRLNIQHTRDITSGGREWEWGMKIKENWINKTREGPWRLYVRWTHRLWLTQPSTYEVKWKGIINPQWLGNLQLLNWWRSALSLLGSQRHLLRHGAHLFVAVDHISVVYRPNS